MAGKTEDISDAKDVEDRKNEDSSDGEDVEDRKNEDSSVGKDRKKKVVSDDEEFIAMMKRSHTGVFWDAVRCPLPRRMEPDAIHKRIDLYIREGEEDITGQTYIWVYVDETDKEGPWSSYLTEKTWESRIYFVPAGADKYKRRCRMLTDILLWRRDFHPPSLLFLVSDKVKDDFLFSYRLTMIARTAYRVFLAAPDDKYQPDTEARWPESLFDRLFSFADQKYC